MSNADEIEAQLARLEIYRRNLAHYLLQGAKLGEAYAPPAVIHGIHEARHNIQKIKQTLRDWNVVVKDHPDDGPNIPLPEAVEPTSPTEKPIDRSKLRTMLTNYFSDSELRDLCFDMGIDYEMLPGSSKGDRARELIMYSVRHNRLDELTAIARRLRPSIN